MTDNKPWHCGVRNQDPHTFITWTPTKLPKFGDYEWRIHVAIVVLHQTESQHHSHHLHSDPTSQPSTPRAILVLKKSPTTNADYGMSELPNGNIKSTDHDVEDALHRIIKTTTGLHFDQILGTLTPIQIFDANPDFAGQINLRFVVSVTEAISLDTLSEVPVTLSPHHESYRWIHENDAGYTEAHRPMKYSQQKLVNTVFDTHCFEWHDTLNYLSMVPPNLPFTDRFTYIVSAAVVRINRDTMQPQILLIQRGPYKKAAGNWELPGGKIYTDDTITIRERLYNKLLEETGLSVCNVLASTRKKPSAFPPRRNFQEALGMVNLAFLVKVEDTEGVELQEEYSEWKWIGSLQEVEEVGLKMTFGGLKTVREALEAVAEGFRAGEEVVKKEELVEEEVVVMVEK